MKKICIFVGNRANYSSIKSVMKSICEHPQLKLQLVLGASAVLNTYGNVQDHIIKDGFNPDYIFHNLLEGESPATMAKSTGLGLMDASMIFENLQPDMLIVIGDRFEMMSVTLAAAYMNITIVHTMGGEVTGTIDESIRHAITKFSHIHFPANEDSKQRIIRMGEDSNFVFNVGCPRIDLVAEELNKESHDVLSDLFDTYGGVGNKFDLSKPFLLVSQHPVTTEYGNNREQIEKTLESLDRLKIPTIMLWPNPDAGGADIAKGIRSFRENNSSDWLHLFKNLPTNIYIHLMNTAACLVGNSSSGVREGAFIGTPVVNIGTRQNNRLRANNVIQVDYDVDQIESAIKKQIHHGKYKSSSVYGDGFAGKKIVDILLECDPNIQKTITY